MGGGSPSGKSTGVKTRARSSSLVTVTEVGGGGPENEVDSFGVGPNENAAWVNGPGERGATRDTHWPSGLMPI
jgi:hypothetical protein